VQRGAEPAHTTASEEGNREKTRYLWAFKVPKWKKPHKMRLKRYFSTGA
jgi:hypothetical protein